MSSQRAARVPLLLLAVCGCAAAAAGCARRPDDGALLRRVGAPFLPRDGKSFGATLGDFDGDGWPDLFLSTHGDRPALLLNRGDLRFAAPAPSAARPAGPPDQHGASACDADGDGDWDIFVSAGSDRGNDLGWSQLWRQDAPLRFTDLGAGDPLLADPVARARGALWLDLDGDARPELLRLNYQSPVRLLGQDDAGRWRDRTALLPVPPAVELWAPGRPPPGPEERGRSAWVHTAVAADFDGDGRTDLLALGRPGFCGLWRGEADGPLRDVTSASGLRPAIWPHVPSHAAAGDVDGDDDLDLVLAHRPEPQLRPQRPPLELWRNDCAPGAPRFTPAPGAALPGVAGEVAAVLLADLDNDGELDLFVVRQAPGAGPPNLLLRGDGQGGFRDVTAEWGGGGEPCAAPESALAADLDRDGDLDLLAGLGGGDAPLPRPPFALYRNGSSRLRGVTLELVAQGGPPHGLGAVLTLEAGGRRRTRAIACVAAPHSGAIGPAHFGVGEAPGPFPVTVRWPSGATGRVVLPSPGAAYRLREGESEPVRLPPRHAGAAP